MSGYSLLKQKLLLGYRVTEKTYLPYITESYHKWEEYITFIILLQTTHFILAWAIIKPTLNLYNDIYYIFAISTSLFFTSYPPVMVEAGQVKRLPLHTESPLYLAIYAIPIILLSVPLDIWDNYVFSASNIHQWNATLWVIFGFNVCFFFFFIIKNLILAYQYDELLFHISACFIVGVLLFPAFLIKSVNLHIHHWFFSAFLISFSRFPERPSRVFHAICLGIFIQGISVYGADTIFE